MLESTPLVTVIVPVYNVERYIKKCIESILIQSYSNFELILVDDGSPDACGKICDEYAKLDKRIKVIHKENGGLSDARNTGIKIARGEYIALIDSDDFVSSVFLEILIKAAFQNNADVVCSGQSVSFYDEEESTIYLGENVSEFEIGRINPKQALKEMLYKKRPTGAPFNLYKKSVFDDLNYPVGFLYEDLATTYKIYIKAKKMSYVNGKLYAYRKRKDSIIHQEFSEKKMVVIDIAKTLYSDICEYDQSLAKAASQRCFDTNFHVFLQVPNTSKKQQKKLWKEILRYRRVVLFDNDPLVRKKNKYGALVSYFGMNMAHMIGRAITK